MTPPRRCGGDPPPDVRERVGHFMECGAMREGVGSHDAILSASEESVTQASASLPTSSRFAQSLANLLTIRHW